MRTRTETRTRQVPHTIDGRTVLVDEPYKVHVPVPPRDWDRIVRTGVTGTAALIGVASVAWSTASIGALLNLVVVAPAAYGAALVFDAVWIACMALEWLARYDPNRAALPRRAGWAALTLAMAAVGVHGYVEGQLVIGIVGATVSGLAKGLWTVVLAHHATPLDSRTQQWVDVQRAEAGGRLAMVAVRRELTRSEALVDAEQAALRTTPEASPETPEDEEDTPDGPPALPSTGPMTIADAVRTALSCGFTDPDAVVRYVRKVADANAKEDTVLRTLRMARRTA